MQSFLDSESGEIGGRTSMSDASGPRSPVPDPHIPVLLNEVIAGLDVRPGGAYIDGTVGAGGHAAAIMERAEGGRLLGLDTDPSALALAAERLRSHIEAGPGELVRLASRGLGGAGVGGGVGV